MKSMTGRAAMLVATVFGVCAAALPLAIDPSPRLIWNASASVPIGLYVVGPATRLEVDDLVVVRPPEDVAAFLADGGYLPRGVPLLKRILAHRGQIVCRIGRAITVDSLAVGDARDRDSRGRALPLWQGCRVIADGDVFLMNRRSADSLDGRYFGPLPSASVVGRAKPLWIVGRT
jgi:conjugative transfer signal peptidase TraF